MMKYILSLFCFLGVIVSANAQSNQNIVILWDVSGSLLPKENGLRDFDGIQLQTYSQGNGLWMELKKSIIDCIEFVEEDPCNKITIVTFNDNIRDVFSQNASAEGKNALIKQVKSYKYKNHRYTNIVEPINKFYSLLDGNDLNIMFLFTDGYNDEPSSKLQLVPTLDSWEERITGCNAYGFYVLVHPDADQLDIRKSIESQDNFWIVPDAKVRVKFFSLPSFVKYNLRDEKGPKILPIYGKCSGVNGEVELTSDDPFFDIFCSDCSINNGEVGITVVPKSGMTIPENHTVFLSPRILHGNQYTFIGPEQIRLEVTNLPERSLNVSISNNDFGKSTYRNAFWFSKGKHTDAVSEININFSDRAKIEYSSAIMRVYLVNKNGDEELTPKSQKINIYINGRELNEDGTYLLTSDMTGVVLSFAGTSETESSKYYGRIELIPSKLDYWTINETQDSYKWHFKFIRKCNPLLLLIICLLIFVFAYLLIRILVIRPLKYPKFGSIQKTISVPGMAPLVIKFKGARMVVLSSTPQKQQSVWDCFWNGKILYKLHPAFTTPILLKPTKGRRIRALTNAKVYHIHPNPIPGVGAATIDIIQTNQHITIN